MYNHDPIVFTGERSPCFPNPNPPDKEGLHVGAVIVGQVLSLVGKGERDLSLPGLRDDILLVLARRRLPDPAQEGLHGGGGA